VAGGASTASPSAPAPVAVKAPPAAKANDDFGDYSGLQEIFKILIAVFLRRYVRRR
jgi:hypothetical protein